MLQTREIDLYLKRNTGPTYVPFVQYENGWALKINLKDVEIPANSSATIYVKKPSGLGVYNTATINSNSVTCEIDSQMLAEHGKASAQVQISKDDLMISTFTVIFDIRQSVADGCEESHNESNVLQDFVDRAEDAADAAEEAVGQIGDSVEDAEAWAKGTRGGEPVSSDDPTYHNNAKYYADRADDAEQYAEDAEAYAAGTRGGDPVGSSDPAYHNNAAYYADEAADSATAAAASAAALVIDATLTQSGQAADAKKTGDEITDIKADLDDIFEAGRDGYQHKTVTELFNDGSLSAAVIYPPATTTTMGIVSMEGYNSWYVEVTNAMDIFFDSSLNIGTFFIGKISNVTAITPSGARDIVFTGTNPERIKYTNGEGFPTESNKLHVNAGDTIMISLGSSIDPDDVVIYYGEGGYVPGRTILNENIRLNDSQIEQVKNDVFSDSAKQALLACIRQLAWSITGGSYFYDELAEALGIDDE